MSRISEIPVRVESDTEITALGGGVTAILHEIAAMLERLAAGDEGGAIDLKSLPLGPGDYRRLQEALGEGEVDITLNIAGTSRIRETGVRGVWWVQHRDLYEDTVAELIEVTSIPAIVLAQPEDVASDFARLSASLASNTPEGVSHDA